MKTRFVGPLLLCGTLMSVGCVSPQPTSLESMRDLEARKLALRCYTEREGERLMFGPHATFIACHNWARKVMQVRYPQAPSTVTAFN